MLCLCCAGFLSEQAKDEIEEHVGLLVRTITQSLEALKNGVTAAQQPQADGQPLINEHTAAHLHGAVSGHTALLVGHTHLQLCLSLQPRLPQGRRQSLTLPCGS